MAGELDRAGGGCSLRIGLVTKYLERPVGHGTYAAGLLSAFAGEPQTSFHLYVPRAPIRREWPANVSIHAPASPPGSRAALAAWELVGAPRSARRGGVDLIHYLYPAAPLSAGRAPVVVGMFDTIEWTVPGYARSLPERALQRRQLRGASRVIVPSAEVADDVHRLIDVDRSRLEIVPLAGPPVPARAVSSGSGSRPEDPYLLFVGGSEHRKNLPVLLDAFSSAATGALRLKVVGPTGRGARLESREVLESLVPVAHRHRVEWLGEVSPETLARLYGEATALVYPSRAEGFGYPVLEAAAAGTPVISSRVPAIAAGFEDAALLVDPDDAGELGRALERVASDPLLRERLAQRGASLARSYSWGQTAAGTLEVYRRLLAERGRGPGPLVR